MLLITLLLFVVNWEKIKGTLEATGFVEAMGSTMVEKEPVPEKPVTEPAKGDGSLEPAPTPAKNVDIPKPAEVPAPAEPVVTPAPSVKPAPAKDVPKVITPPVASPMEQVQSTRVAVLYLVRVDEDGAISRHEVKRTVAASDSPMTDALEALMLGPNTDELNRGFISLIPSEARLLSAQVRGSTAYLNFSETFMYNRYGIEGYAGQLKQIVYTATGFSTVKDVQILIDGQKRDYLGGDGVYIGKPLSRASF
jgi:spore germination protein GerM